MHKLINTSVIRGQRIFNVISLKCVTVFMAIGRNTCRT